MQPSAPVMKYGVFAIQNLKYYQTSRGLA
jgi:hypothetical protein